MDKAQKQLIDTYYRKRKIANNTSNRVSWDFYEIEYAIKSDVLDLDDIKDAYFRSFYLNGKFPKMEDLTNYINKKFGTDFLEVGQFNMHGVAPTLDKDYTENMIDVYGKTGNEISLENLNDSKQRAVYFNLKFGTNYSRVEKWNHLGDNIFLATEENDMRNIFIDEKNQRNAGNLTENKIDEENDEYAPHLRAAYINTKFNTRFYKVYEFNDQGIAKTEDINGNVSYFNKFGK